MCTAEQRDLAYAPFVAAARRLRRSRSPKEIIDLLGSELAAVLEELVPGMTTDRRERRAEPEMTRGRLFEGYLSVLEAAALKAPVVLVIEDLHWSDPPSLDLMSSSSRVSRTLGSSSS